MLLWQRKNFSDYELYVEFEKENPDKPVDPTPSAYKKRPDKS